jgi:hypothetical protein
MSPPMALPTREASDPRCAHNSGGATRRTPCPLYPESGHGRAAAQYVAKGPEPDIPQAGGEVMWICRSVPFGPLRSE